MYDWVSFKYVLILNCVVTQMFPTSFEGLPTEMTAVGCVCV